MRSPPPISPPAIDIDDRFRDPVRIAKIMNGAPAIIFGKPVVIDNQKATRRQFGIELRLGLFFTTEV